MIIKFKPIKSDPGRTLNYIMGGKYQKDQPVDILDYSGLLLSESMRDMIESKPTDPADKRKRKREVWKIAHRLEGMFTTRAARADSRVANAFMHIVISYSPEDLQILTPELRKRILREYMQMMGIDCDADNVDRAYEGTMRYLATVHYETNAPHDHSFLCRINSDGKAFDRHNEKRRSERICLELSKKYKLHVREDVSKGITEANGYTICKEEYVRDESRTNEQTKAQDKMRRLIHKHVDTASSMDEFTTLLKEEGITVIFDKHAITGQIYGIKYRFREHQWSGTELEKGVLSYSAIEKGILKNQKNKEIKAKEEQERVFNNYKKIWYEQLAPLYDRSFKVCSELYKDKRELWDRILEDNEEIRKKYAQIADLKAYNEELKKKLFDAQTSSDFLFAIGLLLLFLGPLVAIALLVVEESVSDANKKSNIAERRAVREEMTRLFNEIGAIKKEQTALRNEAKELVRNYKESVAEKKIFEDTYKAIKEHMAVPILAEKFENISKFFPEAKKVIEGNVRKSNNGYDMFFINVDGQKHVAAELDGKVVASVETIDGPFYVNKLQWKDEKGKEYLYGNGKLKEKEKLQEQPNPDARANIQTTAAPIPAQPVTVPEPQSIKPAGSEKQQAPAPTSESTPMVEKRSDLIETLKQNFPFRDSGHMQYIIESTTDASIFFYGNVKDSKYANFPTEEHYQDGQPRTIDKYEEARDMLKRKVYSV